MTKATPSQAIVDLLKRMDAKVDQRIDLYEVGVHLIMAAEDKYTQEDVLAGLLYLESLKIIEIADNALKLTSFNEANKVLRQASL
ncbi:hypothetical protein [Rhizobium herbae]